MSQDLRTEDYDTRVTLSISETRDCGYILHIKTKVKKKQSLQDKNLCLICH